MNTNFNRIDVSDYDFMQRTMKKAKYQPFVRKIQVLLISDRLFGCTKGVEEYLRTYGDIEPATAYTKVDACKILKTMTPDIVVVVGYLKNPDFYEVIEQVQKKNRFVSSILHSRIDEMAVYEWMQYHFTQLTDRSEDASLLLQTIYKLYENQLRDMEDFCRSSAYTVAPKKIKRKKVYEGFNFPLFHHLKVNSSY